MVALNTTGLTFVSVPILKAESEIIVGTAHLGFFFWEVAYVTRHPPEVDNHPIR